MIWKVSFFGSGNWSPPFAPEVATTPHSTHSGMPPFTSCSAVACAFGICCFWQRSLRQAWDGLDEPVPSLLSDWQSCFYSCVCLFSLAGSICWARCSSHWTLPRFLLPAGCFYAFWCFWSRPWDPLLALKMILLKMNPPWASNWRSYCRFFSEIPLFIWWIVGYRHFLLASPLCYYEYSADLIDLGPLLLFSEPDRFFQRWKTGLACCLADRGWE